MKNVTAVKERCFSVTDFSDYTLKPINTLVGERVEGAGYGFKSKGKIDVQPKKLYNVDGKSICYCLDEKVYEYDGKNFSPLTTVRFSTAPEVFTIPYRGGKGICIVSDGSGVILGDGFAFVNFPEGKGYLVHNGVLCCYRGDKVFFGGAYDYAGYTVSVKQSGFIGLPDLGEVLHLYSDGEKLIVFCEKGVGYIFIDGYRENYRLEYPNVYFSDVERGSFKSVNGVTYFVMKGGLYAFNGTLKNVKTPLDGNYKCVDGAFSFKGCYALPVYNDENYLLVYDTVNGNSFFSDYSNKLFCDGGDYVDSITLDCGTLDESVLPAYAWKSKFTDFNDDKLKTVYKITCKCSCAFTIKIESENGVKSINIEQGDSLTRLNMLGKQFAFSVFCAGDGFALENLKIYYRS